MLKTSRQTRKLSPFFLFPLTLFLVLLLSLPWVSAEETRKPKPQDWEINGIVAALSDSYAEVRLRAAYHLTNYQLDDPKSLIKNYKNVVDKLAKQLQDQEPSSRIATAIALRQMQAKDQAPQLVALLKDSDSDVRSTAAEALGEMQAKDQAPQLVALFKDSDPAVRRAAVNTLGEMQAKDQAPQLVALFKDSDPAVRNDAAYALGKMQAKDQAPQLIALLKDSDYGVASAGAYALKQIQAKDHVPQLVALLKDSDSFIRRTAVEALGEMQAKDQAPQLVALLKDSDSGVGSAAAKALGEMQAKDQAPQVVALLKDSDTFVRKIAIEALGEMQAKDQAPQVVALLKDSDTFVRSDAVKALGQMQAKDQVPQVTALLKDSESFVRKAAVEALGQMQAKDQAPQLVALLKDSDSDVRRAAAYVMLKLGQQGLPVVVEVLDVVHHYPSEVVELRFLAHFTGSGKPDVEPLMQWIGKPKSRPENLTLDQGRNIMKVFDNAWKVSKSKSELRNELAEQIGVVAKKVSWKFQDFTLLERHKNNLQEYNDANVVQQVINNLEGWKWLFAARNIILIHIVFWLALIFAYPKFPQIQAIFFWNPWVRRIGGAVYVGFLLTWVPFLRRKLFEPFKPSLLADTGLDKFNDQAYFPESAVKVPVSGETLVITKALPSIKGQIVLMGDSGLGKSMFIRQLVKNSQRITVYLPAQKCNKGIIEAIQAKLHGLVQDTEFLKSLIYSGAMDICIDGLNEVTADTRAGIVQFVEKYFRGNIIMATQPLEWIPPSTAKIYELQPLQLEQSKTFLVSRQQRLPKDAKVRGADYEQACTRYLEETLKKPQSSNEDFKELAAAQRILSNPMDLTLIALMLSQDKPPDLFHLQEQQYRLMAEEYQLMWQREFPLKNFSKAIYQMRLNDEKALPANEFYIELEAMENEKYKMVISRQWKDVKGEAQKEWNFRHDKILDFFLVQNFLGDSNEAESRLIDHIGDPRFRGVYFLLAILLPFKAAQKLREELIQYAADTKNHTISDTFVQLLRSR